MFNVATLNCRGIKTKQDKIDIVSDIARKNVDICCLQETHIKEVENYTIRDNTSGEIYNVQTLKTKKWPPRNWFCD